MRQLMRLAESPMPASSVSPPGSPTPSPGSDATVVLTWNQTLVALGITAVVIVLIGLGLILSRRESAVRSWIASSLVAGLVLFCVITFAVADSSLRSMLMGALSTAVGAVITFYFTSKEADRTHDLLQAATVGSEVVPDLTTSTETEASARLGTTTLRLRTAADSPLPAQNLRVTNQDPKPGASAPGGSTVSVTYG